MAQIMHSKGVSTKFKVLSEIAANQPKISQKDISKKIGITPQAVSEYVKELVDEELLESKGRSSYRLTYKGVERIIKVAKELREYYQYIMETVVSDISVWTAIAAENLKEGEPVSLRMKDGNLYASRYGGHGASGISTTNASKDEDVGVTSIEGIIDLKPGKVRICNVPGIKYGGSKNTDLRKLRKEVNRAKLVMSIGTESMIALRKIGAEPHIRYGSKEVIVDAAGHGVSSLVVCVGDEVASVIKRLQDNEMEYKILDMRVE